MRILVVDDEPPARDILQRWLEYAGHQVVAVADGSEAWALLAGGEKFDYVFSDWSMPEMNGLELLRRVRADGRTADIPFVLMSGSVEEELELRRTAQSLGAAFWSKPVDYPHLIAESLGGR